MTTNHNDPNAQKALRAGQGRPDRHDDHGRDRRRAAQPAHAQPGGGRAGDLWFFTQLQSPKTTEIGKDHRSTSPTAIRTSSTTCRSPARPRSCATSNDPREVERGHAGLVPGREGRTADRPDRVHPERGEYWDSPSSTIVHLYGYVKARSPVRRRRNDRAEEGEPAVSLPAPAQANSLYVEVGLNFGGNRRSSRSSPRS